MRGTSREFLERRVGVHDFTFEACSSFIRITACKIAARLAGLLSRGFDLVSYLTKPLGSYHQARGECLSD